jgi:hypothetical protein
MVRERSKTGQGDTDIYMKIVDGKMRGMFVLDSASKELDMVSRPVSPGTIFAPAFAVCRAK